MTEPEDLERLAGLKEEGILSGKEFEEQKKAILKKLLEKNTSGRSVQSGVIYLLLAWFPGTPGMHNDYAGDIRKATVQLRCLCFRLCFFSLR